jgi:uroporphyrinogen-III synthase
VGEVSAGGLKGKRVVVTRAAEQSKDLVRALEEKGALPVVLPLVAFAPPENLADLDESIHELSHFDWIFLTSQNALRALQERCQALHLDLRTTVGHVRVAAVGPATAEAVKTAGVNVAYLASKHQGVFLAQELAAELTGKSVFLPRSDRANPELVEELHRLGAAVKEVVAYKTVAPDEGALAHARTTLQQGADAILLFSPSAVHHLQDMLGNEKVLELSRRAIFAAIGPVTERALRVVHVERVLLAEDTTAAAIVDALASYFSTVRRDCPQE